MDSNPSKSPKFFSIKLKSSILASITLAFIGLTIAQEGGGIFSTGMVNSGGGVMGLITTLADQLILFRINSPRDLLIFLGLFIASYGAIKTLVDAAVGKLNNQITSTATGSDGVWAVRLISAGGAYVSMTIIGFWFAGLATLLLMLGGFGLILYYAYEILNGTGGGGATPDGGVPTTDGGLETVQSEIEDLKTKVDQTENEESQGAPEDRVINELEMENEEAEDIVQKLREEEIRLEEALNEIKSKEDQILESEEHEREALKSIEGEQQDLIEDAQYLIQVTAEQGIEGDNIERINEDFREELESLQKLETLLKGQKDYAKGIKQILPMIKRAENNIEALATEISELETTEKEMGDAEKKAEQRAGAEREKGAVSNIESQTGNIESETHALDQERKKLSQKIESEKEELETEVRGLQSETEVIRDIAESLSEEESSLKTLKSQISGSKGEDIQTTKQLLENKIDTIERVKSESSQIIDITEETVQGF
ncbi:MAG: hypothetical protein ABEK16_03740 [Candidatus Nanohalobium sp.]